LNSCKPARADSEEAIYDSALEGLQKLDWPGESEEMEGMLSICGRGKQSSGGATKQGQALGGLGG
jgi:hypothetical protein